MGLEMVIYSPLFEQRVEAESIFIEPTLSDHLDVKKRQHKTVEVESRLMFPFYAPPTPTSGSRPILRSSPLCFLKKFSFIGCRGVPGK
jgi:hypothetical protein